MIGPPIPSGCPHLRKQPWRLNSPCGCCIQAGPTGLVADVSQLCVAHGAGKDRAPLRFVAIAIRPTATVGNVQKLIPFLISLNSDRAINAVATLPVVLLNVITNSVGGRSNIDPGAFCKSRGGGDGQCSSSYGGEEFFHDCEVVFGVAPLTSSPSISG